MLCFVLAMIGGHAALAGDACVNDSCVVEMMMQTKIAVEEALATSVRLVSSSGTPIDGNTGLLQMEVGGVWKYVCDDNFDSNSNGATIACKELGYSVGQHADGSAPQDSFYDDVNCDGSEARLVDCPRGTGENCGTGEAVILTCSQPYQASPYTTKDPSTTGACPADQALTESECAAMHGRTLDGKVINYKSAGTWDHDTCGCYFDSGSNVYFNRHPSGCSADAGEVAICKEAAVDWSGPFDTDIPGTGLGGTSEGSLVNCQQRCVDQPECAAIQYSPSDTHNGNNCFTFDNQNDAGAQYKTFQIYKFSRQA